jgi:hypothetical protein
LAAAAGAVALAAPTAGAVAFWHNAETNHLLNYITINYIKLY